jgi:hypothetical protein
MNYIYAMKKLKIILVGVVLISFSAKSQVKDSVVAKESYFINEAYLFGKWQSEDDSKWLLVFNKQKLVEMYDNEALDTMFYKLSTSCDLKDSSSSVSLLQAFLLFGYDNDPVTKCYQILNLSDNTLSCMNNKTGEFFIFKKTYP